MIKLPLPDAEGNPAREAINELHFRVEKLEGKMFPDHPEALTVKERIDVLESQVTELMVQSLRKEEETELRELHDIIKPYRRLAPIPKTDPAPWSNKEPKQQGKWHDHHNSEKLILDRGNNTWVRAQLTEEQRKEVEEDMGTIEVTEPPEQSLFEGDEE